MTYLRRLFVLSAMAVALACGSDGDGNGDPTREGDDDGPTILTSTVPASGCDNGGVTVSTGPDVNVNGVLDADEVVSTYTACNDPPPYDVLTSTTLVSFGDCDWGGHLLHTGKDTNRNGVLDVGEILTTEKLCNAAVVATGVVCTWTGAGGDALWSNASNWSPAGVPASGDALVFAPEAAITTHNDLPVGTVVWSMLLSNHGVVVEGDDLMVASTVTVSSAAHRIDLDLWTHTTVDFAVTAGSVDMRGSILGRGSVRAAGAVSLGGPNAFGGQLVILSGTTTVNHVNAIPDTAVVDVHGTLTVWYQGASAAGFTGPGQVQGFGNVAIDNDADLDFQGSFLMDPGVVHKRGAGAQRLGELLGGFECVEGSVVALGPSPGGAFLSGSFSMAAGTAFTGSGDFGGLQAQAGTTVSIGGTSTATARLISGSLAGATLVMQSNSVTDHDLLGGGVVDIDGAHLVLTGAVAASIGDVVTLVDVSGSLSGTFAGLAEGDIMIVNGGTFRAHYTTTTFTLTAGDF